MAAGGDVRPDGDGRRGEETGSRENDGEEERRERGQRTVWDA